jgi:hypothetical protein
MPDSKKRARAEGAEEDDPTCSICLEALEPGALCATLPCNHDFHQKCISTWLKQNKVRLVPGHNGTSYSRVHDGPIRCWRRHACPGV